MRNKKGLSHTIALCCLMLAGVVHVAVFEEPRLLLEPRASALNQNQYPQPPTDRSLIYLADESNALRALPFETATTGLRFREVARSDKRGSLDLAGEHSATVISRPQPHFYLFVQDVQGARPPFIVRLEEKGKSRRVGVMTQKGFAGYAVSSEEIIRPRLLVLKREDGMLFMQVSPREPLLPGEYAFVGGDPTRIATFRIVSESNP